MSLRADVLQENRRARKSLLYEIQRRVYQGRSVPLCSKEQGCAGNQVDFGGGKARHLRSGARKF